MHATTNPNPADEIQKLFTRKEKKKRKKKSKKPRPPTLSGKKNTESAINGLK
jgi:hypothetical protein